MGEVFNLGDSLARGMQMGSQMSEMRKRNQLSDLFQDQGAGIASGDPLALNALAALDPMQARKIERQNAADARAQENHTMGMQLNQARLDAIHADAKRQAAVEAAKLDAAEAERNAAQLRGVLAGASQAYRGGAEVWQSWVVQNEAMLRGVQIDPASLTFDAAPMVLVAAAGVRDGLTEALKYGDHLRGGGGGDTSYSLNPQYGVDEEGNPVILQLGKNGVATQAQLPDGVTFQKEPIRIDAGSHFVLLDPVTRQPVGRIDKDLEGAESAKVRGREETKAAVEAEIKSKSTLDQAETALRYIDEIRNHEGLKAGTGFSSLLNIVPGTVGRDFQARVDRLSGGAFLTAIDQLKGMGALSDTEGRAARDAVAALDTAQSEDAFLAALSDYERIVSAALERAQRSSRPAGGNPFAGMTNDQFGALDLSTLTPEQIDQLYEAMSQ